MAEGDQIQQPRIVRGTTYGGDRTEVELARVKGADFYRDFCMNFWSTSGRAIKLCGWPPIYWCKIVPRATSFVMHAAMYSRGAH